MKVACTVLEGESGGNPADLLRFYLKGIIMNQLTLNIDVPAGIYIDLNKLEIAANEFIQKYIGQMVLYDAENNVETKRTHSFRKLRGVMSSDKPYKEMLEDALKEKYSIP